MSQLDKRRILGELSRQLIENEPLSAEQSKYLGSVLGAIAKGEDANKAFSISFGRGESKAKAIARGKIGSVMHCIAGTIAPVDGDPPGLGLSVEAACALAVPYARLLFGDKTGKYDADYLRKCWYAPDKKHMQSPVRTFYSDD
jgi:hypothetical protein